MTEAEWLEEQDPFTLLRVFPANFSKRKLILIGLWCCQSFIRYLSDPRSLAVIAVAEAFVERKAAREEMSAAEKPAQQVSSDLKARRATPEVNTSVQEIAASGAALLVCEGHRRAWGPASSAAYITVLEGRELAMKTGTEYGTTVREVGYTFAPVMRDILGNPFRPVTFLPEWRTSTAVALAGQMYESRDFGAMPILADALQDAGCDSANVLDHCRGAGPHVRGVGSWIRFWRRHNCTVETVCR